MNWAWCCVRACFGEAACVLPRALLATKSSLVGDGVSLLSDSSATRSGALTELAPSSFAVLWAAMLVALLLVDFTILVVASGATTLRLHRDGENSLLSSNGTVATAILAFFSALVKLAP